MRKAKEVLRLYYEKRLGVRQIGRSLSISHVTVSNLLNRFKAAGLSWPLQESVDEASLEALFYPSNKESARPSFAPDMEWVHRELRRKSVTLQLLWLEYRQNHPDGYQYSQFCELTASGAASWMW